jgi:hypothetical protein
MFVPKKLLHIAIKINNFHYIGVEKKVFGSIIIIALCIFFWAFTVICLKGCTHILISGYSLASKDEKRKYKEQYDVVAMNRYIGKMIFLPISLFCTVLIPTFFVNDTMLERFDVITGIGAITVLALCFYAAAKVLSGNKFKR